MLKGKNSLYSKSLIFALFFAVITSIHAYAQDIAKLQIQQLSKSKAAYKVALIQRALEITEPDYGDFTLDVIELTMSGNRIMQSSLEGEMINTIIQPGNDLLDKQHLAVRVPVRLGLLNYRLLLVDKGKSHQYEKVTTLAELNQFKAGLGTYWEATKVYKKHHLNMMEVSNTSSIFSMLQKKRFDYLPRGIYEIYDELDSKQNASKTIIIEPTIALYMPMYTYVYISPKAPRLANRLENGLQKLLLNGEIEQLLYKHYADEINRTNLDSRKIISIESRYYHRHDTAYDKYLLFNRQSETSSL